MRINYLELPMTKPVIEEIIVVEGKDDTRRLQEVVVADTIETIGSAINEDILEQIEHAQETRGVIVFTDPDFSGEKIRKKIMEVVPNAKHAFLARRDAAPMKGAYKSLGVEHASDNAIIEALRLVSSPLSEAEQAQTLAEVEKISKNDLIDFGLIAGPKAKEKRERLGEILRIGYTNGKQLEKRLKMFRISPEELAEAMRQVEEMI